MWEREEGRGEKQTDKAVSSQMKEIQGEKTEGERKDTKRNKNITFSVFTNISMS